jgi:dUTPase
MRALGYTAVALTVWAAVALFPGVSIVSNSARAAAKRPHFTDIAGRSHFSYRSNNNFTGRKYFPQPMCGGVGILDYDQDGHMDIFFTNGAKFPEMKKTDPSYYNCLLRNKGDGTFEDVTQKAGLAGADLGFSFGVAVGDYDNDGYPDLFICNAGRNALYHNNRDGTFADVTEASGIGGKPPNTLSVAAAWFDYDNDGLLDLVVSNYTLWTPQTDIRCAAEDGDRYCNPRRYVSVPDRLYHNLGNGKFTDVTEQSGLGKSLGKGMGVAIADFNQDGRQDIFVANDTERNFLFLNKGDGTFQEAGLQYGVSYNDEGSTVSAMGCDVNDYDNDGWVDVFYNNLVGQIWALFRNQSGRSFRYVSQRSRIAQLSESMAGWSNGFIDYNNDGWKDLYSANGDIDNVIVNSRQYDSMFENVDGKHFENVSQEMGQDFLHAGYQRGSAFADLNNDGFPDIVVTSLNERPRILINSADNGNRWLTLALRGRGSNRDAIGAVVKVTTPSGRSRYNHVNGSVGFMSTSDRRLSFGLGSETSAASVEIRWPRGAVQTLHNISAGQILKVEEPQ